MLIQAIAIFLLIERLTAFYFISLVLRRQYILSSRSIDTGLVAFRRVMMMLAIIFLLGNIIPTLYNINYAFIDEVTYASPLAVAYSFSNATMALAASIPLWNVYRIASRGTEELTDSDE